MNSVGRAGREVECRNVFESCSFVDELGASATGELVVSEVGGGEASGALFVECGRICWAAARGLARRLTECLAQRAAIAGRELETVFLACKAERTPFGEALVTRGILSAGDLREALLEHTCDSLRCLFAASARAVWKPRAGNGYSPRFTFTTAELVTEVGRSTHETMANQLKPVLEASFAEGGDWGAAFVRRGVGPFPEPVATHGIVPADATSLIRLGKWAASALDMAVAFSDEAAMVAVARPRATRLGSPGSLVAFRHGGVVIAGETGVHGPARILNRRARERRNGGIRDADL